jgi:hypothetical protein
VGPIFATLSCFTHATPHPIFSQSEHIEASSSLVQLYYKYGKKHSFHWLSFTCLYPQLQWIYKIHVLLYYYLIMVTFIIQILYYLYSLALLLSLSLIRKRLRSYRTLAMALKLTNYSIVLSLGTHVTFSQTCSFPQTLSLISPYYLLLSLFQTLKQSLSSLPYARTYIIPCMWNIYVISVSGSK